MKLFLIWLTSLLIVLVMLLLSACGGGGGGGSSPATVPTVTVTPAAPTPASAPTPAAPPVTSLPHHVLIVLRGDSTNYGSHPGEVCGTAPNQTCANPAALLQTDVDLLFGKGVVTVVNRAEPGSTLANDLNGTGPYTAGTLAQELARLDPGTTTLVLTNSELNDATYGVPVSTYTDELETWVATVQRARFTPVLMEPNPTYLGSAGVLRSLDAPYVAAMTAVSQALGVPVLTGYDAFRVLPGWQGYLQADGEHPTDAGYEFKEGQYMRTLYPILKQLVLG